MARNNFIFYIILNARYGGKTLHLSAFFCFNPRRSSSSFVCEVRRRPFSCISRPGAWQLTDDVVNNCKSRLLLFPRGFPHCSPAVRGSTAFRLPYLPNARRFIRWRRAPDRVPERFYYSRCGYPVLLYELIQ